MPDPHEDVRRRLLEQLSRLPAVGDVLDWQRSLAEEIIAAESPSTDCNNEDLKYHRHLLRVIGDGLAHSLIPPHTLRSLAPQARNPPSLASQGKDFDFVMETAATLYSQGLVPIVADLTNLIGTGDLVCTNSQQIVVLECKNRLMPTRVSTSGRLARQRERGERTEKYLSTSTLRDEGGELLRIALDMGQALPEPDWFGIEELLRSCQLSPLGVGLHTFGRGDYLLAIRPGVSVAEQLATVMPPTGTFAMPALAHYSELIDSASYNSPAPCNYPISVDLRIELLERRILLTRLADMRLLDTQFDHEESTINLSTNRRPDGFTVQFGKVNENDYYEFLPSIVEVAERNLT